MAGSIFELQLVRHSFNLKFGLSLDTLITFAFGATLKAQVESFFITKCSKLGTVHIISVWELDHLFSWPILPIGELGLITPHSDALPHLLEHLKVELLQS